MSPEEFIDGVKRAIDEMPDQDKKVYAEFLNRTTSMVLMGVIGARRIKKAHKALRSGDPLTTGDAYNIAMAFGHLVHGYYVHKRLGINAVDRFVIAQENMEALRKSKTQ